MDTHLGLARKALNNKHLDSAMNHYKSAQSCNKNSIKLNWFMGDYHYYAKKDYVKAIEEYDKVLDRNNGEINTQLNDEEKFKVVQKKAKAYQMLEKYNEALEVINMSKQTNAESLYLKGSILLNLKEYKKALDYYNKALQYDNNCKKAKYDIIEIYCILNDEERLLKNIMKLIKIQMKSMILALNQEYCFISRNIRKLMKSLQRHCYKMNQKMKNIK